MRNNVDAGTNSKVWIELTDKEGHSSGKVNLSSKNLICTNNPKGKKFEKAGVDIFEVLHVYV